jgi:excisionase family DNA binding protein
MERASSDITPLMTVDIKPVMTVKDLCNYLKLHPNAVYRLLKSGDLPAFRIGDWRFNREQIDRWRAERERKRMDGDTPVDPAVSSAEGTQPLGHVPYEREDGKEFPGRDGRPQEAQM